MAEIRLTRRELYDLVWSQPMIHLAKTYGLSDVGLAKLCKRLDIPRPPRGYWAQLEAGYKPKQTPLPNPDEEYEVTLDDSPPSQVRDPELASQIETSAQAERQPEARIEVADSLRGAHQLVTLAKQELGEAEKSESGVVRSHGETSLSIAVSKAQMRRALLIMDALLKGLQARGYTIAPGPTVTIFDQRIRFSISEQLSTVRTQPEEHDIGDYYQFGHSRFQTSHVPSGKLALSLEQSDLYGVDGCRKSWRDAEKQKLENCLNKIVAGLVEAAARKREHAIRLEQQRREKEEADRKREEEARQRAERRKLQANEKARVDALLEQAKAWRKSQDLRTFIEAVRASRLAKGETLVAGSELEQWVSWATQQADRIDPLRTSPPSILDEVIPDEPKRWSW